MFDSWFQKLCCRITDHKLREPWAYSMGRFPCEYYYKCRICGKIFWNYDPFDISKFESKYEK
jgi:hypothetical protein